MSDESRSTVVVDWNTNQPTTSLWGEGKFEVLKIRGSRIQSDPVYAR